MNLHHVSLFSGIGGFELAMAEAGIPTIAAALAACTPTDSPWRRVARAGGR